MAIVEVKGAGIEPAGGNGPTEAVGVQKEKELRGIRLWERSGKGGVEERSDRGLQAEQVVKRDDEGSCVLCKRKRGIRAKVAEQGSGDRSGPRKRGEKSSPGPKRVASGRAGAGRMGKGEGWERPDLAPVTAGGMTPLGIRAYPALVVDGGRNGDREGGAATPVKGWGMTR